PTLTAPPPPPHQHERKLHLLSASARQIEVRCTRTGCRVAGRVLGCSPEAPSRVLVWRSACKPRTASPATSRTVRRHAVPGSRSPRHPERLPASTRWRRIGRKFGYSAVEQVERQPLQPDWRWS